MSGIKETIEKIKPLDPEILAKAQDKLDNLTKPPGSLGRLEELAKQMAGITGSLEPPVRPALIATFAADHGVVKDGVSAFPQEVTAQMVLNIINGGAGVNVLARHAGADVWVVDVGVAHDFGPVEGLIDRKLAPGTESMLRGPAMSMELAEKSVQVGIDLAQEAVAKGYSALGTGEMGIGNTTPASAIAALYSGLPAEKVTGRGTGLDDGGLAAKVRVIERALEVNKPNKDDPLDVLAKVGGLEIGAICGLCLGGAAAHVPVVVDGFISTAGALLAVKMCPGAADYLVSAHRSVEIGHTAMLREMGLNPLMDLDFRLGEGTGAAIGLSLVEAAVKIMTEMATFASAGVTDKQE